MCATLIDRKRSLFRRSLKFREASSDETGTKPFYGSNFCEISDNHAPLTVFEVHFIDASYRISLLHINGYERSLLKEVAVVDRRNRCGSSLFLSPVVLDAHREEQERGKLGAKFVLYCLGRHSGASPIVSCILQRRSHREPRSARSGKLILALSSTESGLNFRHAGWLYHLPPRQLSRTSPVTVMIYRWIIVCAVVVLSPRGVRIPEHASGIQCTWTVAESRSMSRVTQTAHIRCLVQYFVRKTSL